MNKEEINGFQIDVFNQYDLKESANQGICPLCSEDRKQSNKKAQCASYDWDKGLGTCHNCSTTFQMHTYQRKGASEKVYVRPQSEAINNINTKVEDWFKTRSISKQTLQDLRVSEGSEFMPQTGKQENTIQFNYFMGDQLINIKYRDGRKNFKLFKGAEKIFYNINSVVGYESVIIVEGEMDVLAFHEAGIKNVISVPNGATLTSNNLDYLDNCIDYLDDKKIILALDADEPGQALKQEFIRRLGAEACFLIDLEGCKDANECLIKCGPEKLRSNVEKARPVPLEGVSTLKDVEDELVDFVKNGFKPGFQIGLENFDKIFSTYTGQFITVTGIPSSGKSDFVDQMCVGYNNKYQWKTAFASPENQPTYLHAHKLMRKVWMDMPSAAEVYSEKWNQVADHVNDNFFFIDMDKYTLESVLRKGAELVKRKGIKCLVIDPFNKVRDINGNESGDVNVYTLEYLSKIEIFAKKYDVLVIVVAHPTKMYKGTDGKIEEPTMYNIKGGGEWYDASYHGLLVHRDYDAQTVKAKVLKVKFQNLGENGAEAHFTWERRSGSFIPIADVEDNAPMPWENA